ncbi:MAG: hypothetical protein AAFQ81_06855 [Pseudomonadota bacterium]
MADRIANLQRAVRVLDRGARFYESAAARVQGRLAVRFRAIAAERRAAAEDIAVRLDALGADRFGLDWWGRVCALQARLVDALSSGNGALFGALDEHEDRTLASLRGAIESSAGAPERRVLEKHLAIFRESRDLMKGLKQVG